jgi:ubiquinone/menaquinone biosynthesis C-methylase UbiE
MSAHPMLPEANHDEMAEQLFIRDLKGWIGGEAEAQQRALAERLDPGPQSNAREEAVYEALHGHESFRSWASLRRTTQEMLWDAIAGSVERQGERLNAQAEQHSAGSLDLTDDAALPAYIASRDVHLMPGGYQHDDGGVLQGAIMDRGGAVYMLGRNGGLLNDGRGRTVLAHLFARFPDFAPTRILELGCGIGASLVPIAKAFPDAEVHGIDLGAAMLRYSRARAASMGVTVHLAQDDAEGTRYPDGSFDFVFSAVLMHETEAGAIPRILAESRRLLAPGGVAIHLEVPQRYETMDLWGRIRGQIEADYNNEPAWREASSADYEALMRQAGFADVAIGYQDAARGDAVRGGGGFGPTSKGVFGSWFVASGRA